MVRRPYNLPPMTALTAFEATARHLSVKRAAAELNVTPGAVSHQIRALEGDLGCQLFRRVHRGLVPTADGEALSAALGGAFGAISIEVERLRRPGAAPRVAIGASTAVSMFWLTPRLPRFWRSRPDIRVDQHVVDTGHEGAPPKLDLWILYGDERGEGEPGEPLFSDLLQPVASPELIARGDPVTPETLHRWPLIRFTGVGASWTDWDTWFPLAGLPLPRLSGPRFNSYPIALQAAEDGAGIVLGWRRLIRPLVRQGRLVPLDLPAVPSLGSYQLHTAPGRPLTPGAEALRDWLRTEAAAERATDETSSAEPESFPR